MEERERVIAAVSGGVDSMVLLDLLAKEREALGLSIIVAHFNFQLRGKESEEDERFVVQRARSYGFEPYVDRADTAAYAQQHAIGIQEAARRLRYEFFDNLLLSSGFDKIATAHNADDNAETMLLNLFRGAGVAGLAGIPVYREDRRIIRPLLFAERREIEAYAAAEKLPFRNDSSNEQDYYTRNYLRHNIVPIIRQNVNPHLVQTLNRSAEVFRELEAFLTVTAREHYEAVVTRDSTTELHVAIPRLRTLPRLLQQYLLMQVAQAFANRKPEFEHIERMLELTEGLTGSWVPIGNDCMVYRDRESLVFRREEETTNFRVVVLPNRRYHFDRFTFASEVLDVQNIVVNGEQAEYVDAEKLLAKDLVLRSWAEGDWFVPLGMKSKKKISDFFVDEKIPLYEKRHIPLLETSDGEVVWVCGLRLDDRFKVTPETRRVMKLQFFTTHKSHGA